MITEPSSYYTGGPFYTAEVVVPICLPKHKVFTPSFHSCIVSRSYTIEFTLSYHTPGTNVSNPSVVLKVPLHISSEGSAPGPEADGRALTESELQAAAEREIDNDFFAAAGLDPPSPEYTEQPARASLGMRHASVAAPPSYFDGYRSVPRSHSVSIRAAG
jgi:hypothetical protein